MPRRKTDLVERRGLPTALDVERFMLGLAMLDEAALVEMRTRLDARDFSLEKHRVIYLAILELLDRGEGVDRVTVIQELMSRNKLESVDGMAYVTSLDDGIPVVSNIDSYVRILKRKTMLRRIALASHVLMEKALCEQDDPEELLQRAAGGFMELSAEALADVSAFTLLEILEAAGGPDRVFNANYVGKGIPTGFTLLDRKIGGLQRGELFVIGARPSMGKSALMLDLTRNVSAIGSSVMIFSLEMTKESLLVRMCCQEGVVDSMKVRLGELNASDREKLLVASARLCARPVFIDDTSNLTMLDMQARVRRYRLRAPVDVVMIDYLGLCKSHEYSNSRATEVGLIAKAAKELAKELAVPVVLLSQLSRACEARSDKRPILSDLRESGDVEAHADTVAFLYREAVYKPDNKDIENKAELIIRKQRNGPIGVIPFKYVATCTRFDAD